ncbi:AbrB/MazE/SpoVT family DNA-binding domain-containing protein [Candidatus Woesearchaeota archaeon]|nr:AbrB/MazE/SpoVT family DNA-binding domain-containing protein [Candidatus Woesearchaeota archaeon]
MKRKVVQQGPATLMVSLPSKWVKANNISKGDELEVTEDGKELGISVKPHEEYQKIDIKIESGNEWYISQVIRNLYLAGFAEFIANFDDKETIKKIQDIVYFLLGFVIIEQKDYSCVIKNLSTGVEKELDNLLRKIFLLTKSVFEVAIDQLKNKDLNVQRIKDLRDNVHRFSNLYRRTITKKNIYGLIQNRAIFIILTRIMMICNNVVYAHNYLNKKKKLPSLKPSINYLKKTSNLYDIFYDIFFSKKFERLAEIHEIRHDLINNEFVSIAESMKGENVVVCHYYAEIVRLIATNGGAMVKYHFSQ